MGNGKGQEGVGVGLNSVLLQRLFRVALGYGQCQGLGQGGVWQNLFRVMWGLVRGLIENWGQDEQGQGGLEGPLWLGVSCFVELDQALE